MAHKLFSTGAGILRRAEGKETIDGLDRTSRSAISADKSNVFEDFYTHSRPYNVLLFTE